MMMLEAQIKTHADRETILSVRGVTVGFGDHIVLDKLDLDVYRGEILGFVGASGTGKSVLMRTVLRLIPRRAGEIHILGADYGSLPENQRYQLDMKMGVLFQHGALFSALTVKENIQFPMREYLDLPKPLMDELARLKIELVGLAPEAADKYPSELSGGMIKRAALARALALDPALVFLDEPTSGLDPIGAAEFDELITKLRDTLGLTVYFRCVTELPCSAKSVSWSRGLSKICLIARMNGYSPTSGASAPAQYPAWWRNLMRDFEPGCAMELKTVG
jgi:phospholipid/cholesterol/gamma-HCH transport system ATP-binding protein